MATVSVAMVVRDSESVLQQTLGPLVSHVDEVVIGVDHRTTDRTREIATSLSAQVFNLDWFSFGNSFAEARNRVLEKCTKEWILIIDDDEIIEGAEFLRADADEADRQGITFGGTPYLDHLGRPGTQPVRFFKNHCGWKYEGSVHELPVRNGKPPEEAGILLENVRIRDNSQVKTSKDRDHIFRRLIVMYERGDRSSRTLFYLAREYQRREEFELAFERYREYVKISTFGDEKYSALIAAAGCLHQLGREVEALEWYASAKKGWPERKTAYGGEAMSLYLLGRKDAALQAAKQAASMPNYITSSFTYPDLDNAMPFSVIAQVSEERQKWWDAYHAAKRLLEFDPSNKDYRAAYERFKQLRKSRG